MDLTRRCGLATLEGRMRWYVFRNGETAGPVEEAQVAEWVRMGMTDGMVRDEAGGPWLPLAESPFVKGAFHQAPFPAPPARLVSAALPLPRPHRPRAAGSTGWKALAIVAGALLAAGSIGRFVYKSATGGYDSGGARPPSRLPVYKASEPANHSNVRVTTECARTTHAFRCKLIHRSGGPEAKVCIDIVVECKNGTIGRGHDCGWVDSERDGSVLFDSSDVQGLAPCDSVVNVKATNVVIESPHPGAALR